MIETIGQPKTTSTAKIKSILESCFLEYNLDDDNLVEVALVTEDEIKKLNQRYRKVDQVTDVLSFPQSINPGAHNILGTIVVCEKEAQSRSENTIELIKHGFLHLMNYNHDAESHKWDNAQKRIESIK